MIAHNPRHESGRAGFPHPALALGDDTQALQVGVPEFSYAAECPPCTFPCLRFVAALASVSA